MPSGNIPEPNDGVVACGNQNDIPLPKRMTNRNGEENWNHSLELDLETITWFHIPGGWRIGVQRAKMSCPISWVMWSWLGSLNL